jgi:AbrB family looped-hinge helix DNA binding protein
MGGVSGGPDTSREQEVTKKMPLISGRAHLVLSAMTATVILDKRGRILIPKPMRDKLRLAPGDNFESESSGEELVLRPIRKEAAPRKKRGK